MVSNMSWISASSSALPIMPGGTAGAMRSRRGSPILRMSRIIWGLAGSACCYRTAGVAGRLQEHAMSSQGGPQLTIRYRGGGLKPTYDKRSMAAEDLLQQFGGACGRVLADRLLLLADHGEQAVQRLLGDVV